MHELTITPNGTGASNALSALCDQQLLCFMLGDRGYAVGIDAVREILKAVPTTELPRMPRFVRGVMNLRGAVVPVIDLSARLGLGLMGVDRRTCIIIVELPVGNGPDALLHKLGVMVDSVNEVIDAGAAQIEAVPQLGTHIPPEFISGMARIRGEFLPVLAMDRVLDSDDLAHLIGQQPTVTVG
jgi:purine-binding chemotaxis protein CheW